MMPHQIFSPIIDTRNCPRVVDESGFFDQLDRYFCAVLEYPVLNAVATDIHGCRVQRLLNLRGQSIEVVEQVFLRVLQDMVRTAIEPCECIGARRAPAPAAVTGADMQPDLLWGFDQASDYHALP
jgi:hypothetical protein